MTEETAIGQTGGSATISFREIPRTTRLYQDYLYAFERVAQFYNEEGLSLDALARHARTISGQSFARNEVAEALRERNLAAGATPATLENIERLRRPDSVVIITGQQAGLFGGPLFTIYKALTAVKIAEHLRGVGINAVPLFWIASEDHDFEEINHTQVIDREGHLRRVVYTACPPREGKPVGQIEICEEIGTNIDELLAALPESEFVSRLESDLRQCYVSGRDFAEAFGCLMMRLIGHHGIVLINPLDERLKMLAGEIYERALVRLPDFAASLVRQSASLETSGYHAQVHTGPEVVPLFAMDDGRRTALILRDDGRLALKGSSRSLDYDETVKCVRQCPDHFSPNVTLRPIVQDFLLPTAAIIGGAAEIAYFAQIRPGYQLLDRPAPLILPRASLTLVEKRHAKTMTKFNLRLQDLFEGNEAVMRRVVERSLDQETARTFDETEKSIAGQLDRLRTSLQAVDPTLAEALKGGREKILYQLQNLRTRFINNRSRRDEATHQQIERLTTQLYPHRNLQERELNVVFFLARYGYGLIDRLYEEIDPGCHDHRLVAI